MATPRSLYDVLNVSPQAEGVVIEAAYKALMKKYHPDAGESAGAMSRDAAAINEAFSVLKDPGRRAQYDHRLWTSQQAQRLAELRVVQPPRRGSRLFVWGGWLAAAALSCVLVALASGRSAVPATSALLADGGLTGESPVQAAAIKAAAAEDLRDRMGLPSSAAILSRIHSEKTVTATAPVRRAARSRYASPPHYRKARRARAAQPVQQDQEFHQREGYIY